MVFHPIRPRIFIFKMVLPDEPASRFFRCANGNEARPDAHTTAPRSFIVIPFDHAHDSVPFLRAAKQRCNLSSKASVDTPENLFPEPFLQSIDQMSPRIKFLARFPILGIKIAPTQIPMLPYAISIDVLEQNLERTTGIEPASSAWKAVILPLNYIRMMVTRMGLEPMLSP